MKSICDNLAACGRPVPEEDQILCILAGLGSEFEPSVAVLTLQDWFIQCSNCKCSPTCIWKQNNSTNCINWSPKSATVAVYPKKAWQNNSGHQSGYRNSRGQNSHSNRGKARGRGFYNKFICQLCGKSGHTVHRCYHRFDTSFLKYKPIKCFRTFTRQQYFFQCHTGWYASHDGNSTRIYRGNMLVSWFWSHKSRVMILVSNPSAQSIMVLANYIWVMA